MADESKARSLEEIDAEIAQVKKELEDVHGTEAEVYTRIVGYYRSVRNWNKGKREEYKERKVFKVDKQAERKGLEAVAELHHGRRPCGNETAAGAHLGKNVMAIEEDSKHEL